MNKKKKQYAVYFNNGIVITVVAYDYRHEIKQDSGTLIVRFLDEVCCEIGSFNMANICGVIEQEYTTREIKL